MATRAKEKCFGFASGQGESAQDQRDSLR